MNDDKVPVSADFMKVLATELVVTLPASKEPWKLTVFMDRVIAANPEHGVHIIRDGVAIPLTFNMGFSGFSRKD